MGTRKPRGTNIPDKFEISAYDECAKWGLQEWTAALTARMNIRHGWRWACLEGKSEDVPNNLLRNAREAADKLLCEPTDTDLSVSKSYSVLTAIRDQSAAEYFHGLDTFNDPRYVEWVNRFTASTMIQDDDDAELVLDMKRLYETPAWRMHADCSATGNSLFIAVDLGVPDDQLVKEFKKWIGDTRKAAGTASIPRRYNNKDFVDWHENRLLAYLDLTFWASTRNKEFTHKTVAHAIFPFGSEKRDSEIVRRTIRTKANRIVSDEVVSALNGQLLHSKNEL